MATPAEWQETMLGSVATPDQLRLYQAFDQGFRGLASKEKEPWMVEAATILALRQGSAADKVMMLVPPTHTQWVLDCIDKLAMAVFERRKGSANAPKLIKGYAKLFNKLTMVSRGLAVPVEPPHWVSIGFSDQDVLPPWMVGRLLSCGKG